MNRESDNNRRREDSRDVNNSVGEESKIIFYKFQQNLFLLIFKF